jgi:hypothetical protein
MVRGMQWCVECDFAWNAILLGMRVAWNGMLLGEYQVAWCFCRSVNCKCARNTACTVQNYETRQLERELKVVF